MRRSSLNKNNVKFHKLKNGSFGLKAWYDADFLKKAATQKQTKAAADAADEEAAVQADIAEEEKAAGAGTSVKAKSHPG